MRLGILGSGTSLIRRMGSSAPESRIEFAMSARREFLWSRLL
jgi:hypothetical protein